MQIILYLFFLLPFFLEFSNSENARKQFSNVDEKWGTTLKTISKQLIDVLEKKERSVLEKGGQVFYPPRNEGENVSLDPIFIPPPQRNKPNGAGRGFKVCL